jgi:hypothetical protein
MQDDAIVFRVSITFQKFAKKKHYITETMKHTTYTYIYIRFAIVDPLIWY